MSSTRYLRSPADPNSCPDTLDLRLAGLLAVGDVELSSILAYLQLLQRKPLAGPVHAVAVEESIHRAMGPANQVRPVLAEELPGPAVEWHGKMPAQVPIGNDVAVLVEQEQGRDRNAVAVKTQLCRADQAFPEVLPSADEDFHCAQSFPGSVYVARAGTATRSRLGNQMPVSQPP